MALTLLISVIPEALSLAVIYCLSEYSSLHSFNSGHILFKRLKSLENMGRLDCLCIEKQGTLTLSDGMEVETFKFSGIDFPLWEAIKGQNKTTNFQNFIVPNIWFNNSAWFEKRQGSLYGHRNYKTHGNITEQALLKYLLDTPRMKKEVDIYKAANYELLHWQGFNSLKKRSVIVMRFINFPKVDDSDCSQNLENLLSSEDSEEGESKQPVDFEFEYPSTEEVFIFSKGAHEQIMEDCDFIFTNDSTGSKPIADSDKEQIQKIVSDCSEMNHKILLFGVRRLTLEEYAEIKERMIEKTLAEGLEKEDDSLLIEELEKG